MHSLCSPSSACPVGSPCDDRMALAEEEALQEDDEDSSDEDGASIPQEWNRFDVEGVSTHDEHESRWEYHATEVR